MRTGANTAASADHGVGPEIGGTRHKSRCERERMMRIASGKERPDPSLGGPRIEDPVIRRHDGPQTASDRK